MFRQIKKNKKTSLQNQRSLFYEYLEKQGWDVFDFYVDVESGTTGKREIYNV
ncbi:recombinase family protein [Paenibacillus paeoniae]|uniref:recombinase family protein n=1 Tax=Paenibacillus paeoniae TaxID=2292705 RepID=UPI003B8350B4